MSLILHLVRKDFRRVRVMLGIWCPILILSVVLDATIEQSLDGRGPAQNVGTPSSTELDLAVFVLVGLVVICFDLLMRAAIVSKLVHDDATVGSTAFWLSRPITGGTLLASKAILLALSIIPADIAVQLAASIRLSGSPSPSPEVFLMPVISTAVFMMLAVLTPSLTRMVVLGGIMAVVTGGAYLVLSWLAVPLIGGEGIVEAATRAVTRNAPWLMLLGVCVAVICHQYLTRRTKRSLVIAFSGIPAFLLLLTAGWF